MQANETPQVELLYRDITILRDENRRLKSIIEELEKQLNEK